MTIHSTMCGYLYIPACVAAWPELLTLDWCVGEAGLHNHICATGEALNQYVCRYVPFTGGQSGLLWGYKAN